MKSNKYDLIKPSVESLMEENKLLRQNAEADREIISALLLQVRNLRNENLGLKTENQYLKGDVE